VSLFQGCAIREVPLYLHDCIAQLKRSDLKSGLNLKYFNFPSSLDNTPKCVQELLKFSTFFLAVWGMHFLILRNSFKLAHYASI
jgi:hypothetical protein